MPEQICTFDVGTTGVKAGIISAQGQVLATAYREYSVMHPHPQWSEQSIAEMWNAQCEASREVVAKSGVNSADIVAVGISCQRATFVPVDKDEKPLTNFIGWQDKRSIEQCDTMRRVVGDAQYYQIAGLPIEPTAAVSKILWLREQAPEIFDKTARFCSTQNVHLHQLGAVSAPCDLADAGYIGLLDVDHLKWSDDLLTALGIPADKMPALAPSGMVVGKVSREAASLTGIPAGTPLVTAGGDQQLGALGAGVASPGLVSLAMGTGAGVLFSLDRPLRHPERAMGCLPHAVQGAWEMEGICLASGAAYKWYRDTLGQVEKEAAARIGVDAYDILNLEASHVAPGADGLIIMPSFMGAGAPYWYPKARAVMLGLTLSMDRKTLVRATLEGICLELRSVLEAARRAGTDIKEIRIWGGASKSAFWNQMAADIYGVPAAKTSVSDTGLVGAAICAGIGAGLFKNAQEGVDAMVRVVDRYEPDPKVHLKYDELFSIYQTAYRALVDAGVWERISALDRG